MLDSLYEPDLSIGFIWVVILAFYFLIKSIDRDKAGKKYFRIIILSITSWIALTGIIASTGFFLDFSIIPPRIFYAFVPSVFFVLFVFFFRKGWAEYFSVKSLTWIHVIRVFVEIILLGLALDKQIPLQMTFEGTNLDILSGISAPVVALTCFKKSGIRPVPLLIWNIVCLLLLVNVVTTGVLSAPTQFQQLNFSQPNVAVGYFPFIWLISFVVPVVLFSHLISMQILISRIGKR